MASRLYPEDQKRVDEYLSTPQHQSNRKPFSLWKLILGLTAVIIGLGLLSRYLRRHDTWKREHCCS